MKIFAFNFALHLQLRPAHSHFEMETRPLSHIHQQLQAEGVLFPYQIFYARANGTSVAEVVNLLQDPDLAELRAVVALVFEGEKEREEFAEELRKAFKLKVAAGGMVENGQGEKLLIKRHGLWDLPKGHVEKGETNAEGAVREVEEETGAEGLVLGAKIGVTHHVFRSKKGWRWKDTHWWHMQLASDQDFRPQTEEGIKAVQWWSPSALENDLPPTFPLIEQLIHQALSVS